MKNIFIQRNILVIFLLSITLVNTSFAAILIDTGPGWPDQADVTSYSGSGDTWNNTWLYPNIANSNVSALYFGLSASPGSLWGLSMDAGNTVSGNEEFTWFANTSNSIEYRGQAALSTSAGTQIYWTRYLLTATGISGIITDSTTLGLSNSVHSLFEIDLSDGAEFQVTRQVQVLDGSTWVSANSFFNNPNLGDGVFKSQCDGCLLTDVGTGFYAENASLVSTPSSIIFYFTALFGLVLRQRSTTNLQANNTRADMILNNV